MITVQLSWSAMSLGRFDFKNRFTEFPVLPGMQPTFLKTRVLYCHIEFCMKECSILSALIPFNFC